MAPARSVSYYAFTDPSGGSDDSFTLAISHREGERVVIDAIREVRPPFSPEQVIIDFVGVLKSYRLHSVSGDRFGGEFPREQFNKRGIRYVPSERNKSEIYRDFLPLLNSGNVTLPRNDRLIRQLCSLERTTGRGSGRDSIDHPPGQHDDVANCVAGAAVLCAAGGGYNLDLLARPLHGTMSRMRRSHRTSSSRPSGGGASCWSVMASRYRSACPSIARRRARICPSRCVRPWSGRGSMPCAAKGRAMKRALALTDQQLRLVQRAARSLPVARRDSFLQAVAAQLAGTPADPAVEQAVNVALDQEQPVFLCDSKPEENTDGDAQRAEVRHPYRPRDR